MKTITQTYRIKAPKENVWSALVSSQKIDAWGGGPAKMTDKANTAFTLWGGSIHGKNLVVIPYSFLSQEWYADFDIPSFVEFKLDEEDGETTVILTHTDVPDKKMDALADGWREYYMNPLKKFVEMKRGDLNV